MPVQPEQPPRHVWVHNPGRHGHPDPGLIICWTTALRTTGLARWHALIAVHKAGTNVSVEWTTSDLLDPIADPTPAAQPIRRGARHAWHRSPSLADVTMTPHPALILDHRSGTEGPEMHLAIGREASLFVDWLPAVQVRPVADDEWVAR